MLHNLIAEFLSTGLMILFGVGVHCDEVLTNTKYHGSGHIFAITTWAFGISVCLYIFGGVCMNPAMVLAQCVLGMLPWTSFIPYVIAEFLGALVGALICYLMYKDHFTESEGNVNPIAIRNIFSTNPNCRNLPRNFFVETLATTIFLSAILAVATKYETQLPIGVGLIVWAVGMGLGGTTGFVLPFIFRYLILEKKRKLVASSFLLLHYVVLSQSEYITKYRFYVRILFTFSLFLCFDNIFQNFIF